MKNNSILRKYNNDRIIGKGMELIYSDYYWRTFKLISQIIKEKIQKKIKNIFKI